jgi:hypothetical protein
LCLSRRYRHGTRQVATLCSAARPPKFAKPPTVLVPRDISGRTRSVEDGNKLVRPALNRSNVQEYLAVMSQIDRLVKKWEDQCTRLRLLLTTATTGIVRNIQVDLGNTADSIS